MARQRRVFQWALGASLLLHLSAVTLFNIVIYFPREDIVYADFAIVAEAPPSSSEAPEDLLGSGLRLRGPNLERALGDDTTGGSDSGFQLATLEFTELERLQLRQQQLTTGGLYERIFPQPERDSWGRFGEGIRQVTDTLRNLRVGDSAPPTPVRPEAIRITPAAGYTARIEWNTPPYERELLFNPPMEALWTVPPEQFRPMVLVLEVNAAGRVVNVWSSTADEHGLLDALQLAALRFRFAPREAGVADLRQLASMRLEAADTRP